MILENKNLLVFTRATHDIFDMTCHLIFVKKNIILKTNLMYFT